MAVVPNSEIVSVSISAESGIKSRAAFGIPLLLDGQYIYGATARVLSVSSLQDMRDAGYDTYHQAYEWARVCFAQKDRPTTIKIGQWNISGGETVAVALTACLAADPEFYWLAMTVRSESNINILAAAVEAESSPLFFYGETGDAGVLAGTPGNVALDNLNAARERVRLLYNPQTAQVSKLTWAAAVTGGGPFTGTLDGQAFSVAFNATNNQTLADIATALALLDGVASAVASDADSDGTDDTITITSDAPLSKNKVVITADLAGGAATWAVTTEAQNALDAALIGRIATSTPGTIIEALLALKEVQPAALTAAQRTTLKGVNVGHFAQWASGNKCGGGSDYGKVAAGTVYADTKQGIDWLTLTIGDQVAAILPVREYTESGIAVVRNAIAAGLAGGLQSGFIAPTGDEADGDLGTVGYAISTPRISTISDVDKAARHLPDVTFEAHGAGAIQGVSVRGTITL